jgi:outer membrane receptor protein involved in Fe transport
LDLTPISGLRLRASQQRAIRAPNIQELLAPPQPDGFSHDPCAGVVPDASPAECARTGVTGAQYGHITKVNGSFGYNAVIGGNDQLLPETATTRAIGVVLQPRLLPGLSATIDWWDISLKGAISKIGAQTIVDTCIAGGNAIFCSRIHRDATGSLAVGGGQVDNRLANLGGLRVRGIDGNANLTVTLARWGSANFNFRGSYVMRWIVDNGGLSMPYDCAGLFGSPCAIQPRWKHSAQATWTTRGAIGVSLQWRHLSGLSLAALDPNFNLTDQVSAAGTRLGAQDYVDLATVFRLRKGLQLRLGINNVLDRQPPLVVGNTPAGDTAFFGNTYPQWYDPLGRYMFATVSIALDSN